MSTVKCNPQTKADWRELLAYLYAHWKLARLPVTICPLAYAKGSLRLDGVIGGRSIGKLV